MVVIIILFNNIDAFLEHYGVLGMKWGVRNDPERVHKTREQRFQESMDKKVKQIKEAKNKSIKVGQFVKKYGPKTLKIAFGVALFASAFSNRQRISNATARKILDTGERLGKEFVSHDNVLTFIFSKYKR